MKATLTLLGLAGFLFSATAQTPFWTEDFGTGCNQGQTAASYNGPNGVWTTSITGANAASSNLWYVSATENGNAAGACGSGCGSDRTLHLGSPTVLGTPADIGAAYYEGLTGLCDFFPCGSTSKRVESPLIDCSGRTAVEVDFVYIEGGNAIDNATLWYNDGNSWAQIADPAKTFSGSCSPQGLWTAFSIALPASADNNPNVQIGFQWVNNDDADATDPSFAVDDIVVSGVEDTGSPIALCQDIAVSLDESGLAEITPDMIDAGSTDDVGIVEYSLDLTAFDCSNIGENTVTLTVTDEDDNTDSCTAIVTVVDDLPPVAICQNISISLDVDGNASITPETIDNNSTDNCGVASISIDSDSFDESNLGANAVVLTVMDESGNSDTCAGIVTVEAYTEPCIYDLDNNGIVNSGDLGALLNLFGTTNPEGDFDNNGLVNSGDLGAFLTAFGTTC